MKILIENSGYHLQNMGDVAMLQVGASILRNLVPSASLSTLTFSPKRLSRYVGGESVDPNNRKRWQGSRALPIPIRRTWLSDSMRNGLDRMERRFQLMFPKLAATSIRLLGGSDPVGNSQTSQFVDDVDASDLVVVTGGGFLTDAFIGHANDVLTTMELAQRMGKPTLIFGQGVGPLTCQKTLKRAGKILAKAPVIGIREERTGRNILNQCGVRNDRIVCSGDDAIQLAYDLRPETPGPALGINLRMADYSGTSPRQKDAIKNALVSFVERHDVPSLTIPISFFEPELDADRVHEIMSSSNGFAQKVPIDSPEAIAEAVSRCRMVVTGSYHAGVFALSQGIPVVGLVASNYYQQNLMVSQISLVAESRLLTWRRTSASNSCLAP